MVVRLAMKPVTALKNEVKRLVEVASNKVELAAKRFVVVPLVEEALVNSKLFASKFPLTVILFETRFKIVPVDEFRLSIVAVAEVRLLIVPVDELSREMVPDAEVRLVIVVVAKVDVPATNKVPLAERFPNSSAKKPRFSIQFDPSHLRVELVAEPTNTAPKIVFQKVEVPVLKSV